MGAVFLIKMTRKYVSLLLLLPSISSGYKIVETIDASGSSERQTIEDGPFGGSGGSPWTDGGEVHLNGDISSISMRSGSEVDAITVKYGDTWGPEHGGGAVLLTLSASMTEPTSSLPREGLALALT